MRRAEGMATGSYALTDAPDSIKLNAISIEGASRMSSVLGLKASPSKPIVLPFRSNAATFGRNSIFGIFKIFDEFIQS